MPCRAVVKNKPMPSKAQSLATGNSPSGRSLGNASVIDETLRGTSGSALKSVPDVHVTFEGLLRHESRGTSRRSDRRENYASARRNKPSIVRKLTLASGPLPLPTDADFDTFHGMRRDEKRRHRLAGAKTARRGWPL